MGEIKQAAGRLRGTLLSLARRDSEAFDAVLRARRMPQSSEAEVRARAEALAAAELAATRVPLETGAACLEVMRLAAAAAERGNPNAATDAGVAGLLARAAAEGAILNVEINLKSLPEGADKQQVIAGLGRLRTELEPVSRRCAGAVRAVIHA
jgi:glutamate formiminotransferase/formiminotetrahydrofolate cyclodeaminase